MNTTDVQGRIAPHFQFDGELCGIHEMTSGHINVTYCLEYADGDGHKKAYTLQRINTVAFRDPASLMRNIGLVTEHIRKKLVADGEDPARRVLHFVKADNGTFGLSNVAATMVNLMGFAAPDMWDESIIEVK